MWDIKVILIGSSVVSQIERDRGHLKQTWWDIVVDLVGYCRR